MAFSRISLFTVFFFWLASFTMLHAQGNFAGDAKLAEIEFKPEKKSVRIAWNTLYEKGLREIIVQRSIDNVNFFVVGNFTPGNRNYETHYEFVDRSVSDGINYYRIKLLDTLNNEFIIYHRVYEAEEFSKAVDIKTDAENYKVKVSSADQIFTVELTLSDELNRLHYIAYVQDNTHEITAISAPVDHGIYYLTMIINKTRVVRKKVCF